MIKLDSNKIDPNLISFGNETIDKFLGGGLLHKSLNLFERQGPSSRILDLVWNHSLAATTLILKHNLIVVNFNPLNDLEYENYMEHVPVAKKVKTELLYKDIRGKTSTATVKIAWRYSSRSLSPDANLKMDQVDFGGTLLTFNHIYKEIGKVNFINVKDNFSMKEFFSTLEDNLNTLRETNPLVNIIFEDFLHPFSPINNAQQLCKFMYTLRCFTRTMDKGAVLVSFDTDMCPEHSSIKQYLYNLVDSVVTSYSFETGQDKLTGYKNMDGTLEYLKVPKINTFGLHFQRELSDWGYRFTRNLKYFMIDELSLPPNEDDDVRDKTVKQKASDLTNIEHSCKPLKQVGPLEEFKGLAEDVLVKPL